MPEKKMEPEDRERLERLLYGLGIRLAQAQILSEYQASKGEYYFQHFNHESNEWPMEEAILPFVSDRLCRAHAIVWEARTILTQNHALAVELDGANEIVRSIRTLFSMHPHLAGYSFKDWPLPQQVERCENVGQFLNGVANLLPKLQDNIVTNWVSRLAQASSHPGFMSWFTLGQLIVQFYDERDIPGAEDDKPEWFSEIATLTLDDVEKSRTRWFHHVGVDRILQRLALIQSDVFPEVNRICPYQKEIVGGDMIPFDFPGWLRVDAGFWSRIYGLPKPLPPMQRRRELLLTWRLELPEKDESRCNAKLKERWNRLTPLERDQLTGCEDEIETQTVKKELAKARNERELENLKRLKPRSF